MNEGYMPGAAVGSLIIFFTTTLRHSRARGKMSHNINATGRNSSKTNSNGLGTYLKSCTLQNATELLYLREFCRPCFFKRHGASNFRASENTYHPARNPREPWCPSPSEIQMKWSPKLIKKGAQIEPKVMQNVQGEYPKSLGESGVKRGLPRPLQSNLAPLLDRRWFPFWRTLDFEGIPK